MINRLWSSFSNYDEFKQNTNIKEYGKVRGFFLKIFRHAQVVVDEQQIKHYVRKGDLRNLDPNLYQLPKLNHRILINNILKYKPPRIHYPEDLSSVLKTQIKSLIDTQCAAFLRSEGEKSEWILSPIPPYKIEFRKVEDKLSILLSMPDEEVFDLIEGVFVKQKEKSETEPDTPSASIEVKPAEVPIEVKPPEELEGKELNFIWPADLNFLGISEEEKQQLNAYLEASKEIFSHERLENPSKIERKKEGIPLSLLLVPGIDGRVEKIFLLPRSDVVGIVGRGSFKAVKRAYDITTGEFLVKKVTPPMEAEKVKRLQDQKRVLKLRAETKKGEFMRHYEPLADGTITQLMNRPLTREQKIYVVKELLKALKAFHEKTEEDGQRYYHGDIKTDNVLFKQDQEGKIRIFLTDFGFTNRRSGVAGTAAWSSPEQARRLHNGFEGLPYEQKILGNELDVWAMGLCIASLLSGKEFSSVFSDSDKVEQIALVLANLNQGRVDQEINRYRRLEEDGALRPMWEVVRGMLSVDPERRWTAAQAFQEFQRIFNA
jgi:hypothetical protein